MDAPRTVPAVSAHEAEEFFTDGTQEYPAESPAKHNCCGGIDMPGVGIIHCFDCPTHRPRYTQPVEDYIPGQISQHLCDFIDAEFPLPETHTEKREQLLARLISTARRLALQNLGRLYFWREGATAPEVGSDCQECHAPEDAAGSIRHLPGCETGEVIATWSHSNF